MRFAKTLAPYPIGWKKKEEKKDLFVSTVVVGDR
jgi:hypothetical protein